MDWFDQVRTTMFQLYQRYGKVIPLTIGVNWYKSWDNTPWGIIPNEEPRDLLGGHDIKIAGFQNFNIDHIDYIVLQGTWGTGYGDNGLFRVPREVFNKWFNTTYCAYMSDDQNVEVVRLGWIVSILTNIKYFLLDLLNLVKKDGNPPPPPPPTPVAPPTFLWDTPANSRHSVRVICDQQGLSVEQKNTLCACVQVESDFNPKAVHFNKDKNGNLLSTDYGIVQVNDYWHIGPGKDFPSVDYVLQNPEACVKWMCKMWLAGKQSLWCSYTSGAYKKYL